MRKRNRLAAAAAGVLLALLLAGCGAAETVEETAGMEEASSEPAIAYADTLFDTSYVHTLDVVIDGEAWDAFVATATEKEYVACDVVIDGELYENVALRAKGNSSMQRSQATGKYSFKVEFDHFIEGQTYQGLDKLGLNNLVVDDSCMRDYIVYRMMARFGEASPLCSFVFVTVNGEDWGFYLAVEAVEDAFLARNYGAEHGNLFKPDNLNNGGMAGGGFGRSDDVKLLYIDGEIESYPNIFGSAKTDPSRKEQYRLIESIRKLNALEDIPEVVDVEAVLRYLVVHSFVCNGDSYTGSSVHNYYLYEKEGQMSLIPWDYNEGFGDFGSSGAASVVNDPIDSPVTSGSLSDRPMIAWVFSDEAYVARYHELWREFLAEFWDSGWIENEISVVSELIGPYVQRDPRSFCTYDAFVAGTEELLLFFELRSQSVEGQLNGMIPSTSEGQAADSSALIDASALGSASGGMGGMPGGGMPARRSGSTASGEASGSAEEETEDSASEELAASEEAETSEEIAASEEADASAELTASEELTASDDMTSAASGETAAQ